MYDNTQGALKSAAARDIASNSIGGQLSGAGLNASQPVIANALLGDLAILVDKARSIEARQMMLRDRIFGSNPQASGGSIGKDAPANGFLDAVQRQTTELHYIFERISSTLNELERIA